MATYTEYAYSADNDNIRINIFKRINDENEMVGWDADIWSAAGGSGQWWDTSDGASVETFSSMAGDYFSTKGEAKAWLTAQLGALKSINPKASITEGW